MSVPGNMNVHTSLTEGMCGHCTDMDISGLLRAKMEGEM